MPSNKDPVTTVQPGPGHLPDGTVSANALDFNPGLGPLAALQAHITNPTGAHAATAISTTVLAGETWSNPAFSNVQVALARAYEGLNARPIWVLDANPVNKGDFVGAAAFTAAVTAIGTHRPILFLRAGTYTWSDPSPTALDNVTIIGVDQTTVIINSSADVRFGDHTDVTNVTFTGTSVSLSDNAQLHNTTLTYTAGLTVIGDENKMDLVSLNGSTSSFIVNGGSNSFSNMINSSGVSVFTVAGDLNQFSHVAVSTTAAFSISGSYNEFDVANFNGTTASGVVGTGNIFSNSSLAAAADLTIGGLFNRYTNCSFQTTSAGNILIQDLGGSDGAHYFEQSNYDVSGEIRVTTSGCTFLRMDSGLSFVPSYIRDMGSNNTYVNVRCNQFSCEGSNSSIRGLEFFSGLKVPGDPTLKMDGTNYTVENVLFSSFSTIAPSQMSVVGDKHTIKQLTFPGCDSSADDLLRVFGEGVNITGVYITAGTSVPTNKTYVRITGVSSVIDTLHITGTSVDTTPVILGGINNTVRNVTFDSMTNLAHPLIDISGLSCVASDIYGTSIACTAGAGFQLVRMTSSDTCVVKDMVIASSANLGTTTDLLQVNGCNNCTFDNIYLNNLGATTNVGSAVFRAVTALSTGTTIRNINVRNSVFATLNPSYIVGIVNLFEINGTFLSKTLMEHCTTDSTVTYTGAGAASILVFGGPATALGPPVLFTMRNCSLVCTATTYYGVNVQSTISVLVEDCYFQTTVSTLATLNETSSGVAPVFINCIVEQSGAGPTVTSSQPSFENCKFIGPSTGSGQQLFFTVGGSAGGSGSFPKPASLKSCQMLVGSGNISASGTTGQPIVFLGGFGSGASGGHGTIIVDGLIIKPKANSGITAWHVAPTLAIDTLNEATGQHSYFNNIQIDLGSIAWTSGGFNCSTFSTNGTTNAGVLEIQGPLASVNSAAQSRVNNVTILNISRTGFGNRHIVKAQGANINGLVIDSVQTAAGSSFSTDLVTIQDSRLLNLDMFPTHSLPTSTGGTAYVKAVDSVVDSANIRNLRVGAAECGYVFNMDGGTLKGSKITAQAGSSWQLEAIVMSSNNTPCTVERNRVVVATQAASSGATPPEALRCFGNACKILFNEFYNTAVPTSGSAPNAGGGISFAVQGNNTLIEGNILRVNWYTDTNSTSFFTCTGGAAFTDFVNNIMINDADPVATGFGTAGGSMIATFLNTYGSIVNNTVIGRNTANRISINAAVGGSRRILSNHVENKDTGAGTGTILTAAGDIPTPVGSYNIQT